MNVDNILSEYNVFLTGASGFVGVMILQRLLSVKNSDSKIYCLLRCGKKYGTVSQRLRQEILTREVFELSEQEIDDLMLKERVIALEGELTSSLLGLDDKALSRLKYSADANNKKGICVIHCAADIDFNRELNKSIEINVFGTYSCIQVCKEIGAKSMTHISTLYVNSREDIHGCIKEKIYESGIDSVAVFQEWMKCDGKLSEAYIKEMKSLTAKSNPLQKQEWPNHYTLTKNIAENVVTHYCSQFAIPHSIIRLGIVCPIVRGPHMGWFMGNGGFVFLVIGLATGNIAYLNGDGTGRPDFVPVDFTVDSICGITANMLNSKKGNIYQIGVLSSNPEWTVGGSEQYIRPKFNEKNYPYSNPKTRLRWIESRTILFFIELLLYEIPLFLLGIFAQCLSVFTQLFWFELFYNLVGYSYCLTDINVKTMDISSQIRSIELMLLNKPYSLVKRANFMKKARAKLNWFNANYSYFVTARWDFDHSNLKSLFNSLDVSSQIKYNFNPKDVESNDYLMKATMVNFEKYLDYKKNQKSKKIEFELKLKDRLKTLKAQLKLNESEGTDSIQKIEVVRKLWFLGGVGLPTFLSIFGAVAMVAFFLFVF